MTRAHRAATRLAWVSLAALVATLVYEADRDRGYVALVVVLAWLGGWVSGVLVSDQRTRRVP